MRKPIFVVYNQVRFKPACAAIETQTAPGIGWSATLLFACNKDMFPRIEAQITSASF